MGGFREIIEPIDIWNIENRLLLDVVLQLLVGLSYWYYVTASTG